MRLAFMLLIALAATLTMPHAAAAPIFRFVSPQGNDAWTGTLAEPSPDASDGPFATLARARDALRALQPLPEGGARIVVRGGVYAEQAPLTLSAEDSGGEAAPVVYAAWPGETVSLRGGIVVPALQPVTIESTLARLDDTARGHVQQASLAALGLTAFGSPAGGGAEVFFDGQPMTLARWPNAGFVKIADIVEDDGHQIHGIKGSTIGKFHYDDDRPARWTQEPDAWLHGYWFWDWSDQRQKLASIDTANKILAVEPPYHNYGYRKGQWYYAYNLLAELDQPGEWYIDREAGVLYFWPPAPQGELVVSVADALLTMKDVSYVTLQGMTFEFARDTAIDVRGGSQVQIVQCTVRNVGGSGIDLSGSGHAALANTVYQVGKTGISIGGGDVPTLVPGGLRVQDNDVHHYGRVHPMYNPGVRVSGVGQRVAHNHIHDAPHMAIQFGGNDHVLEFNEIDHVCEESNDAGAIYAGRNWTSRGHVIRNNFLHHIQGFEGRGCVGVYLDDMFASAAITGNVFYKVTSAAFIGGGRDNRVENNLFIDCTPALHVDARALNWAHYHADAWIQEAKDKGTISGIAYNQPPYSTRYPELPGILDDEPKAPKGNLIKRNIAVGGKWDGAYKEAKPYLDLTGNWVDEDPHFVNREKEDFNLKPDSPMLKAGFEPIPMEAIGPFNGNAPRTAIKESLERELAAFTQATP